MLRTSRRRLRGRLLREEDGSTLMLYPFAILVVFAIGAIAIDAAILFQAHRQAVDVAAGIASDMAGVVDETAFAADGTIMIDRGRAVDVLTHANRVVLAGHPNGLRCSADISGGPTVVEVECRGTGRPLLLPISGGSDGFAFSASAVAEPNERS